MRKLNKVFNVLMLAICSFFFVSYVLRADGSSYIETIEGASIRIEGVQGLRFNAKVLNSDGIKEKGFYLLKGAATVADLEASLAAMSFNGKEVFKVVVPGEKADGSFSVVLTGVPSKGYLDDITAIPYVVNNSDVTFYVNPITRSVGQVAILMDMASGTIIEEVQNIIDELARFTKTRYVDDNFEVSKGVKTGPHQYVDLKQYEFYNPTVTVIALPTPEVREGYSYGGWYENESHLGSSISSVQTTSITETKLYYAKWTKHSYNITFDSDGGSVVVPQIVNYNEKIIKPTDPTREVAEFVGWYHGDTKWDFNNGVKEHMTLKAKWNINYNQALANLETHYATTLGGANYMPLANVTLISEINGLPITWESSNPTHFSNTGVITPPALGEGPITVNLTASLTSSYKKVFTFKVINTNEPPKFSFTSDYAEIMNVNWNKTYNPLKGVKVIDDYDGDITSNIVIGNTIDTTEYGIKNVNLTITNSFGKTATLARKINVVWNYDVSFIGHAGSYYGLMNSEEAIMYGIEVLKYQAIEVDLKQTKDGVFILCYDDTFGGYTLANTNWADLKNVTVTQGRKTGIPANNGSVTNSPYTAGLITLERFLQICKQHNVKAVIELKSSPGITNTDQSRMPALMSVISSTGMLNDVIFLGSQYNCLIWTRNNGYGYIPCQYLVTSLDSDAVLQRCITNNLDVSANITGTNTDAYIAQYKANNLKVAVYTFNQWQDYNVVQSWINRGVDYVTCDWQIMSNLTLPESSTEPKDIYEVVFEDWNGTVLKTVNVEEGSAALPPTNPTRTGYTFTGWDKSFTVVMSNLTVTAQYQIETYTITYDPNVYTTELVSFASKAAMLDEFYDDFYQWLLNYGKNLSSVTVTGATVKVNLNGQESTISGVADLKAVDKYVFEKTFGNLIYKPFNRPSDVAVIMEETNDYFLNTMPYKVKYEQFDGWFLNVMLTAYTAYDRGYNHASGGRVQIMFRFHQWQQGTSIPAFDTLPKKTVISGGASFSYQMPTTHKTYTVLDSFTLPLATGEKQFLGWYLDSECTNPISSIEAGRTGNIIVYAKWAE